MPDIPTMARFELRRVAAVTALLACSGAVAALALGRLSGALGVLTGSLLSLLAFRSLEKALNPAHGTPTARLPRLLAGSVLRVALLAAGGGAFALAAGTPGAAGYLGGILAVKGAILAEGLRSRGG